jgi:hypothetical protein
LREQLIHVLTEAAEIEHNLLCSYLYAAFSFKRGVEDGLTLREAPVVGRWRRLVLSVAVEEMAKKFVERVATREPPPSRITPSSEDYETIGELYALIERELKSLFGRRGVAAFADPSDERQLGPDIVKLPGLSVVRGLDDALSALRCIVEQGEGAQSESDDCHFARFGIIEKEWRELRSANPQFSPAHPAAHDPVMRAPTTDEPRVWIRDPQARARLDLANGVYVALISVLYQLYEPATSFTRKALATCALSLMSALSALGEALARLPASLEHPGAHAGLTFTSPRNVGPRSDPGLIVERLLELSATHSSITGVDASNPIGAAAAQLMRALQRA